MLVNKVTAPLRTPLYAGRRSARLTVSHEHLWSHNNVQYILFLSVPYKYGKGDPERLSHASRGREPVSGEVRHKPGEAGFRVL